MPFDIPLTNPVTITAVYDTAAVARVVLASVSPDPSKPPQRGLMASVYPFRTLTDGTREYAPSQYQLEVTINDIDQPNAQIDETLRQKAVQADALISEVIGAKVNEAAPKLLAKFAALQPEQKPAEAPEAA